jgi:hypothetical protein
MNPHEREQLRLSLLRFLLPTAALTKYGVSALLLTQEARAEGRSHLAEAEVCLELHYLQDKGLVEPIKKALSPENQMWRITANGRDFAAEGGLE